MNFWGLFLGLVGWFVFREREKPKNLSVEAEEKYLILQVPLCDKTPILEQNQFCHRTSMTMLL